MPGRINPSGAQVSLVTRSGTNDYHGSAYEYYRDPGVSSNNWFNKQAQLNSGQSNIPLKILEHTYGASLGLPLKKNKRFFSEPMKASSRRAMLR